MIAWNADPGGKRKRKGASAKKKPPAKFPTAAQMQILADAWQPVKPPCGQDFIESMLRWEPEAPLFRLDGFDMAVVGETFLGAGACVCYSYERIVAVLMLRDGMTDEEAIEYADFNIVPLCEGGKGRPILVY